MNPQTALTQLTTYATELEARAADTSARIARLEERVRDVTALVDIAEAAIALLAICPPDVLETPEAAALRAALETWRAQQPETAERGDG